MAGSGRKSERILTKILTKRRSKAGRGERVTAAAIESYFKVMVAMLDIERRGWVDRLTRLDGPFDSVEVGPRRDPEADRLIGWRHGTCIPASVEVFQ